MKLSCAYRWFYGIVTGMSLGILPFSVLAIPVSNAYISFAGAGGDFSSRTATFTVPDKTTTTPIGQGLRLYEAHLAKMIEVTQFFCKDREPKYIIYWNYEVENGKLFMGEYSLSCQFAANTFKNFGMGKPEKITLHYRDTPRQETIQTLNLSGDNSKKFASLVSTIKPKCIETTPKICPGDRLE